VTDLLSVRGLRSHFVTPRGEVQAVRDVSFDIAPGEIVGLVGESGSGKSATAMSLLRLLPGSAKVSGSVTFRGRDVLKLRGEALRRLRGGEVSMIFQDPMTALDPVFTIGDQLVAVIRAHRRIDKAAARTLAAQLLAEVGIGDVATRLKQYPHQISGGMRQRVLIAKALCGTPGLLVADEPTTALDVTIQAQILRLLRRLRDTTGMAVLLVTHDLGVVSHLCDRVLVMYGGRIVETGTVDQVLRGPRHPYTRALLRAAALPERSQPIVPIGGAPPSLLDPPPGCPFAPRCPVATERCATVLPELTAGADGHAAACLVVEEEPGDDRA